MSTKRTFWIAGVTALVLAAAEVAYGQLSNADLSALELQGQAEGWTFKITPNAATKRPQSELCGLVAPKGWRVGANFTPLGATSGLPVSFDWRTVGGCPAVRDQGGCGSCWAFATVGPLECGIKIKDGVEVDLSEQWLLSCNLDGSNCTGGWFAHDYHQWKQDSCGGTGAVLEADFPYVGGGVACNCPYPHRYWLESWSYIGGSSEIPSTDAIKQAIVKYGPVSVAICNTAAFQSYGGGVFNACSNGSVNHAVVLVGWDDNQGTQGVWFLRNSWGTDWGEGGYGRIEYGCSSVGYGACYVNYPGSDPLQALPADGFTSVGPAGGPFAPACLTYTLSNSGTTLLNWTATKTQSWLSVSPGAGQLAPSATVPVTVCVNASAAAGLPTGNYTDTVTFTNVTTDKTRTRAATLRVGQIDYFTELFDANDNDLANQTVRFTPTGGAGSYRACHESVTAFPTDPTGGEHLSLTDDGYASVSLDGGATVGLYGQRYSMFYVGSNGYITFTAGDDQWTQSLDQHFRLPRISGLLDDLNPEIGGEVSWKQLADRAAVTFLNVPEWSPPHSVASFQIEIFFDGAISITWLNIATAKGVAGLSAGSGVPADFVESNLSAYGRCFVPADFDHDYDVDLIDFAIFRQCFNGANHPYAPGCSRTDFDQDNDVDLLDFSDFRRCFNGSNRPVRCN